MALSLEAADAGLYAPLMGRGLLSDWFQVRMSLEGLRRGHRGRPRTVVDTTQ